MRIHDDFIRGNERIEIISNQGRPVEIPRAWQPVFGSCDMLVAIPDMHMYMRDSMQDNFKYGAEAMLSFLDHLCARKQEMALHRSTLRVYQLGDIYELRFPYHSTRGPNMTPAEIIMSDPTYSQIINIMNSLHTHCIYGNHDFELRHFPGYRFAALEGKVHLEHGFAADPWTKFANPNAPLWETGAFLLKGLREIESFFGRLLVEASVIDKDEHFAKGVPSGEVERIDMPPEEEYRQRNQENYYTGRLINHSNGPNTRITIIGHTHRPFLNVDVSAGEYFFVDAGAWVDGRSNFVIVTDEELAVCHYRRASEDE